MPDRIEIRLLAARDSMAALTQLLHRAYAPLARQGLNFTAATQSVETTQQRAAEGQCFVAEQHGRIVGTVTVCGPYDLAAAPWAAGVTAFRDRDTAHFHQFAVDPDLQRQGLGRRLIAACERWAREHGYKRMALDREIEPERRALHERLVEAALAWLPLIEVWPESRLLGKLDYRRLSGEPVSLPFAGTLTHVFNHGTHHRGQVTAALTALGRSCPELDLVRMLQQESAPA